MNTATITPTVDDVSALNRRDLNALDRCDACGARAWVRAVLPASELLFCAHHAAQHLPALSSVALLIQDDRDIMTD